MVHRSILANTQHLVFRPYKYVLLLIVTGTIYPPTLFLPVDSFVPPTSALPAEPNSPFVAASPCHLSCHIKNVRLSEVGNRRPTSCCPLAIDQQASASWVAGFCEPSKKERRLYITGEYYYNRRCNRFSPRVSKISYRNFYLVLRCGNIKHFTC